MPPRYLMRRVERGGVQLHPVIAVALRPQQRRPDLLGAAEERAVRRARALRLESLLDLTAMRRRRVSASGAFPTIRVRKTAAFRKNDRSGPPHLFERQIGDPCRRERDVLEQRREVRRLWVLPKRPRAALRGRIARPEPAIVAREL